MAISKKSILLTGSKGLIGDLIKKKLGHKYNFFLTDRLIPQDKDDETYFELDISNFSKVKRVFEHIPKLEYIIHLAGDSNANANWESALTNNIHGTWNIYKAASERKDIKRIIFASSNHITGGYEYINGSKTQNLHNQESPSMISPQDLPRPDGPYGISKLTGEAIARYFYDCHNIESVCLRIGTVNRQNEPQCERESSTLLCWDDLIDLFECAIQASNNFKGFGIYYGVSNNKKRFWDISNATKEIGFSPKCVAQVFL